MIQLKELNKAPLGCIASSVIYTELDHLCNHSGSFIMEEWRDINGFDYNYQISNYGNIRKVRENGSHLIMKKSNTNGYRAIDLKSERKNKRIYLHRLVAYYFVDNPKHLPEVNHKDGNKANNYYKNLEWVDRGENIRHSYRIGNSKRGEDRYGAKLTNNQVLEIRKRIEFGMSMTQISYIFGVKYRTIQGIKNGKRYRTII